MNLSEKHQIVFDEKYPKGYDASAFVKPNGKVVDESGVFHIMYIKIMKDGKRTRDVPCIQKYTVQDWGKTVKVLEDNGVGVTGYDEFAIIHDPTEVVDTDAEEAEEFEAALEAEAKEAKGKVKPEPKPKGRPAQNK